MSRASFIKHRAVLMRGWWLAEDGRLYHNVLVQRVQEMLAKRAKDAERAAKSRAAKAKSPTNHASVTRDTPVNHAPPTCEFDTKHQAPDTSERTKPPPPPASAGAHPRAHEAGQFAMRPGWTPSPAFQTLLHTAGLVSPTPQALDAALAEFVAYWLTKPEELRDQVEWDRAFLKNLKRAKVEADSKPAAQPAAAAPSPRRTASRHHGINETNFSEGVSDDGRF
jgi:hypothetical protein